MKLRNKKTGGVVYVNFQIPLSNNDEVIGCYSVTSLKELNESFEDYKPVEPLIKDEKIRKVVRAWAEANATPEVQYDRYGDCLCSPYGSDRTGTTVSISFDDIYALKELKHLQMYTIAELCGEEEE